MSEAGKSWGWAAAAKLLVLACAAHVTACTPPVEPEDEELQDDDLKLATPWNDLLGQASGDRLLRLKPATLSESRFFPAKLSQPTPYAGGTFGYIGPAKAFVAKAEVVATPTKLYQVMVKVLSEKYSCFMVAKQSHGDQTWVKCRDGRQVHFWIDRDDEWVQFQARQYDTSGYEVVVRKHHIERLDAPRQPLPTSASLMAVQSSE